MATINEATSAYANVLKSLQGTEKPSAATAAPSFGEMLKTSAQSAIDAQHKNEAVSARAVLGKADMTEVLQAVNDAEIALNTVLAIRDRVVQAYEQIMRTPI